jgi:hypothetical protein
MRKIIVGGAALAATAVAVPMALVVASPAQADRERHAGCGRAHAELSVDREHRGFEVEAELDDARPGSRWRVVLRHDGKVYHDRVRRADREGDVEVERFRRNTAGADVFRMDARRVGGSERCHVVVRTR